MTDEDRSTFVAMGPHQILHQIADSESLRAFCGHSFSVATQLHQTGSPEIPAYARQCRKCQQNKGAGTPAR